MIFNRKSFNLSDIVLAGLILITAFTIFSIDRNVEFQGDDGIIYTYRFSYMSTITVSDLTPDGYDFRGLVKYGWKILRPFLAIPHGIMPSTLYGVIYKFFIWTGVDFNENTFHLPISLTSALACALLFFFLRQQNFGRFIAFSASVMLFCSPLYVSASRGTACFFIAIIPLTQLIGLMSLAKIERHPNSKGQLMAGLGFAWVALADIMSFLCLFALLAAHLLYEFPTRIDREQYSVWKQGILARIVLVANWKIWLPPSLVLLWYGAATLAERLFPLLSAIETPYLRLFGAHSSKMEASLLDLPDKLLSYPPMLFGEFWALLIPVTAWGIWKSGKLNFANAFGLIATLGYGLLFYVLSGHDFWTKNLYQGYLLLPIVILFSVVWRLIFTQWPKLKTACVILIVLATMVSVLATAQHVWRMSWWFDNPIYADKTHGVNSPVSGAKAIGYLIRKNLLAIWAHDPNTQVELSGCCNKTGLLFYAGINQGIGFYAKNLGHTPSLRLNLKPHSGSYDKNPQDHGCKYQVLLRTVESQPSTQFKPTIRLITISAQRGNLAELILELNGNLIKQMQKTVTYDHRELESKFELEYTEFQDYFYY